VRNADVRCWMLDVRDECGGVGEGVGSEGILFILDGLLNLDKIVRYG
jgi:hypothetical protein